MIRILGVDSVCIRGTFRPLSGADVRGSQKAGSPRDGIGPGVSRLGLGGDSQALSWEEGRKHGHKRPEWGTKQWGLGKEATTLWGHCFQPERHQRLGQQDNSKLLQAVG